jgi:hypothetical protein
MKNVCAKSNTDLTAVQNVYSVYCHSIIHSLSVQTINGKDCFVNDFRSFSTFCQLRFRLYLCRAEF